MLIVARIKQQQNKPRKQMLLHYFKFIASICPKKFFLLIHIHKYWCVFLSQSAIRCLKKSWIPNIEIWKLHMSYPYFILQSIQEVYLEEKICNLIYTKERTKYQLRCLHLRSNSSPNSLCDLGQIASSLLASVLWSIKWRNLH